MTSSALHKSRSAERALHLLDTVVTAGSISLGDAARVAGASDARIIDTTGRTIEEVLAEILEYIAA